MDRGRESAGQGEPHSDNGKGSTGYGVPAFSTASCNARASAPRICSPPQHTVTDTT